MRRRAKRIFCFKRSRPASVTVTSPDPQVLTAIGAIDLWVRTGVRPTNAQFPTAWARLIRPLCHRRSQSCRITHEPPRFVPRFEGTRAVSSFYFIDQRR